jgi:hypothetical protein
MRQWLTTLTLTIAIAVSGIQTNAQPQPLTIHWLSNSNGSPLNTDSRFPSISADGTRVVFQVGNGATCPNLGIGRL